MRKRGPDPPVRLPIKRSLTGTVDGCCRNDFLPELRRRAEQGDAEAQFSLGFRYGEGEGVPEDRQEALKWWRKAAEQGHAMAQYSLGVSYEIGEGVAQGSAETVKWCRLAAEQGNDDAKFSLNVIRQL